MVRVASNSDPGSQAEWSGARRAINSGGVSVGGGVGVGIDGVGVDGVGGGG